ncbi:hypothetical protein AB0H98_02535 [Nocardia salmonicida]|uniref:hypothetical protein n=1 Tax=Nocardia salmonicida TaxID=53431 RepID=UPI00341134D5
MTIDPVHIVTRTQLASALHALYEHDGRSYVDLAAASGVGQGTIHDMASGKSCPHWKTLQAVLQAFGIEGGSLEPWRHAHSRAKSDNATGPGRPLDEITDPFALEVHRPITADDQQDLPVLPPYIRRSHDDALEVVVQHAQSGVSKFVVLVGGSSSGKTRALYEALAPLRQAGGWRLWHPSSPTRREALEGLSSVVPRTVLWLNETQEYLKATGTADGDDEQIATALHDLLADVDRAPVLIVGTLWPEHHATLLRNSASRARHLLKERTLTVPDSFTTADIGSAPVAARADPRLAMALTHATDGRFAQYMAGGPELIARYQFSLSPAAKAIIDVAMDARRVGHRNALPERFLETAASAYLADDDWNILPDDWFEQAVAETAKLCLGAPGPLTRIRPRPLYAAASRTKRQTERSNQSVDNGAVYQLADYLEQYGRSRREAIVPPVMFWEAAARHVHTDDVTDLAEAAWSRGLYRDAAQLWKNAAERGIAMAGPQLIYAFRHVRIRDKRVTEWAIEHTQLGDLRTAGRLIDELNLEGLAATRDAVATKAVRQVDLANGGGLRYFLSVLDRSSMTDQADFLAARASREVTVEDAGTASSLVRSLDHGSFHETHLGRFPEPLNSVAARIDSEVSLDNAGTVADLLSALHDAQMIDQFNVLAARAANEIEPVDVIGTTSLLKVLREHGLNLERRVLAERVASKIPLGSRVGNEGSLLNELLHPDTQEQFEILATRIATEFAIDNATVVAWLFDVASAAQLSNMLDNLLPAGNETRRSNPVDQLLDLLRKAGLARHIEKFASQPDITPALSERGRLSRFLAMLIDAGWVDQLSSSAISAILEKSLGDAYAVAELLSALRKSRLSEQYTYLVSRSVTEISLSNNLLGQKVLLERLIGFQLEEEYQHFAFRIAAETSLHDMHALSEILGVMQEAGLTIQADILAGRAAAEASIDNLFGVAYLLEALEQGGLRDQLTNLAVRAATEASLGHITAVHSFLGALRKCGLNEPLAIVSTRLPAVGMFESAMRGNGRDLLRFGQEPDGSAASPWGWDDLR